MIIIRKLTVTIVRIIIHEAVEAEVAVTGVVIAVITIEAVTVAETVAEAAVATQIEIFEIQTVLKSRKLTHTMTEHTTT